MAPFQNNIFSRLLSTIKEADHLVPKIELFKKLKKVKITGTSRMPDPSEFYRSFANDLENYFNEFNQTLILEFNFEYINTSSTKWLYYVLNHLEGLLQEGGMIEVVWKYEADDESIEETGEFLKSRLAIPFSLKPVA
jgi:hypothetical protein